ARHQNKKGSNDNQKQLPKGRRPPPTGETAPPAANTKMFKNKKKQTKQTSQFNQLIITQRKYKKLKPTHKLHTIPIQIMYEYEQSK
ncbi:hypothetical protein Q6298_28285, partial [Klebsiella pneumoniae]|uniref:hypothetical protein n=1 Tax=Klebsiella pneumoniae TaxID=573 RepID=UPI00273203A5